MRAEAVARIGATGIAVFPLCFGANVFGWTADEEESMTPTRTQWTVRPTPRATVCWQRGARRFQDLKKARIPPPQR